MRVAERGWRTSRSLARAAGAPAPVVEPAADWGALAATPAGSPGVAHDRATGMPWQNVGWSVSLVALLVYVGVTTTYLGPAGLGQAAIIVALVGLLFLGHPIRVPRFLAIFGAFAVWSSLGYLTTDYPAAVSLGIELLWKIWLVALVVVNAIRTRSHQRVFLFFILAAFALYPARGAIFNYVGGHTVWGRAIWNGAYANPNDLAALTLLQIGFATALLTREPRGWPKLAALAGVVLLPVLVLLTQSRGAFLGLVVAGAVLLTQVKRRGRAVLAILGVVAVGAVVAPDSAWERFAGITKLFDSSTISQADTEGSADQRFKILQIAANVFRSDPVDGVGFGAYGLAHANQAAQTEFARRAGGERSAHNTYLTVLAETGVVGGVLYAGLLIAAFAHAERARRAARHALPASSQQILFLELGVVAFLVAGLFGSFGHIAVTYVLLAFLWTVAQSVREELATIPAAAAAGAR